MCDISPWLFTRADPMVEEARGCMRMKRPSTACMHRTGLDQPWLPTTIVTPAILMEETPPPHGGAATIIVHCRGGRWAWPGKSSSMRRSWSTYTMMLLYMLVTQPFGMRTMRHHGSCCWGIMDLNERRKSRLGSLVPQSSCFCMVVLRLCIYF
jgi:hypothetical protein